MKRVLIVMLSCMLYACSQFQVSSEPMGHGAADAPEVMVDNSDAGLAQEQPSLAESGPVPNGLLVSRQLYCAEPRAQRHEKIQRYRSSSESLVQLERMLLMSCEMNSFGVPIAKMLTQLQSAQTWSPEDLAFFAFLKESIDALRAVEAQRYALQVQLEDTIQGITHIEEAIDARGGDHRLAEE